MASNPTDAVAASPKAGGMTVLDLFLILLAFACLYSGVVWAVATETNHRRVAEVITSAIKTNGELRNCFVLVNTVRHEGKCGNFGPYTALVGGRSLYVFSGPADDPILVGSANSFFGFRATQELADLALQD